MEKIVTPKQRAILAALADLKSNERLTSLGVQLATDEKRVQTTTTALARLRAAGFAGHDVEQVRGFQKRSFHYITDAGREALASNN